MKPMKTCTKTNTHEMACKFVDMLYQQGTITAELYERFCIMFLRKVKDGN